MKVQEYLRETLNDWKRVLKLSKKPKKSEFTMIAKITGIGIIIIGVVGFIIRLIVQIITLLS